MLRFTLALVLLAGYPVLATVFVGDTRKHPRLRWTGLAAIAAAAPFFFGLGVFWEQFGAGQCYTSAVESIANAVEKMGDGKALSARIRSLPLAGYETDCSAVEKAAAKLPGAKPPRPHGKSED